MNKCYTVKETAEILGVHPKTVRRLIKDGELKHINISRKVKPVWRVHDTAIHQYIADQYKKNGFIEE